jgi:hypothetical protein
VGYAYILLLNYVQNIRISHTLFVVVLCKIFAKTVRKMMAMSNKANGMQKYRLYSSGSPSLSPFILTVQIFQEFYISTLCMQNRKKLISKTHLIHFTTVPFFNSILFSSLLHTSYSYNRLRLSHPLVFFLLSG